LINKAKKLIERSNNIVVFTGAGMSSESGMRTFRGDEGLWREYSPEQLSSLAGIRENPKLVWEWYKMRFVAGDGIKPHIGYEALSLLQRKKKTLPVITQNVDGLHKMAGQTDVIEIHGSMRSASCINECGYSTELSSDMFQVLPPLCKKCQATLRPDIILFGEQLPEVAISRVFDLAESCDLMIVIGTSVRVWPAAGIPFAALESGADVIEINPVETALTLEKRTINFKEKAGEVLPSLVGLEIS